MELYKVESDMKYIDDISRLYKAAFYADERKPFDEMTELSVNNDIHFYYAILLDGQFIGFMHLSRCIDNSVMLNYFVIIKELRNKGYGMQAMKLLQDNFKRNIWIEVEADDLPINNRRIGFYQRCGFNINEFDFIAYNVHYRLMSNLHEVTFNEYYDTRIGIAMPFSKETVKQSIYLV